MSSRQRQYQRCTKSRINIGPSLVLRYEERTGSGIKQGFAITGNFISHLFSSYRSLHLRLLSAAAARYRQENETNETSKNVYQTKKKQFTNNIFRVILEFHILKTGSHFYSTIACFKFHLQIQFVKQVFTKNKFPQTFQNSRKVYFFFSTKLLIKLRIQVFLKIFLLKRSKNVFLSTKLLIKLDTKVFLKMFILERSKSVFFSIKLFIKFDTKLFLKMLVK